MSDFKERLNLEFKELEDRMVRLGAFIGSESFNEIPDIQQSILRIQLEAMHVYAMCLEQRLENL